MAVVVSYWIVCGMRSVVASQMRMDAQLTPLSPAVRRDGRRWPLSGCYGDRHRR